jgi:hypothetical protein
MLLNGSLMKFAVGSLEGDFLDPQTDFYKA